MLKLNPGSLNDIILQFFKTGLTCDRAADNLFAALDLFDMEYKFIYNTKNTRARDFMPLKIRAGI